MPGRCGEAERRLGRSFDVGKAAQLRAIALLAITQLVWSVWC